MKCKLALDDQHRNDPDHGPNPGEWFIVFKQILIWMGPKVIECKP